MMNAIDNQKLLNETTEWSEEQKTFALAVAAGFPGEAMSGPTDGNLTAKVFKIKNVNFETSTPNEVIEEIYKIIDGRQFKMYVPCMFLTKDYFGGDCGIAIHPGILTRIAII